MITRKDVADRAGVSVATVSYVLNKKGGVMPETEMRVLQAVEELGYVPNEAARNLSLGRSSHIGIALNELTNPYHMEVVKGIEKQASAFGFHVSILNINEDMQDKLNFLKGRKFDVLINFMTQVFDPRIAEQLLKRNTLLVNFPVPESFCFNLKSKGAILSSMDLLRQCGHSKVGYISTIDEKRWETDVRGQVYMEYLESYGFENNPDYKVFNGDYTEPSGQVGYDLGLKLFRAHPEITAVYVTNDIAALGVLRALEDLGLKCPEDVSVIGYDAIRIARLFKPTLATIGCDNEAYGAEMARLVIESVIEKKDISGHSYSFTANLITGESIGRARN